MSADIPPPIEQRNIIKKIEKDPIVIGETLCPISTEWYQKWKFHVGYDQETEPNDVEIPPIGNKKIISNERLANDVSEVYDYFLLRKQSYDLLQKWYTGDQSIDLVTIPDKEGQPTVIKKYIGIEVNFKKDKKNIDIHKFMKITDVHKTARNIFEVPESLKTCLREFTNHVVRQNLEDDKFVDDYNIVTGMQFLLDSFENDKWYSASLQSEFKADKLVTSGAPDNSSDSSDSSPRTSTNRSNGGIVGFNNLGNTCFFNSGTQCLMHTVPLINFMLSNKWKNDLNEKNPIGMKGLLAKTFAALAHEVWSGKYSAIAPRDLKHIIGRFAPQFSGWGQQDSHELILFMLDGVHEDLNRCKKKPQVEPVEGDGTDDEEKAKEAWNRHKLRNDSIVVDLFHGQIRSRLLCPKCQSITVVFDPYMSIPMPIQRPHTKKIKVTYVPFDFFEQRQTFKIEIPSATKDPSDIVSAAISEKIGKEVKIKIGVRAYTDSPVKWCLQDTQYQSSVILAYEIPENENALYIPCTVKMNSKSYAYYNSPTSKTSIPFLVEVNDLPDNFDQDQEGKSLFAKKIEEKLSKIWEPNFTVEETETIKGYEEKLDPSPPKDVSFVDASDLLKVTIKSNKTSYSYSYYSKEKEKEKEAIKTPSKNCQFIINSQATVYLNPKSQNFSMVRFLKNIEPTVGGDDDDEEKKKSDSVNLDDCFEFFSQDEVLDKNIQWYCPRCKEFVCANKKLDIWKVPQILVIQLKRFTGGQWSSRKLDQYVEFPEVIDMKKYVIGPQKDEQNLNYRLFAVSNHMGGLGGGHYTACAKVRDPVNQSDNKGWYYFNDSSASHTSESNAHSSSAYVLFYERI